MWALIFAVDPGVWLLAGLAAIAGIVVAHVILVPQGAPRETPRAQRLALWRTWIGFGFVSALSLPYRSFGDTADRVLGNFNMTVGVALVVWAVSMAGFRLVVKAESRGTFRAESVAAVRRAGMFLGTLLLSLAVMALLDSPRGSLGLANLLFIVFFGFVTFYGAGCWYISRYWFGIGRIHALLPPVVAALTICLMTAAELHRGGPDPLPLRLWLVINFSAVISTLGVCLVEVCDVYNDRRPSGPVASGAGAAQWPLVLAGALVAIAMATVLALTATGVAERTLCEPAIVRCAVASG